MSASRELLIIYNADSTIRGKLSYAFKKISSSSPESPTCAACDITHGGLSLNEVPNWTKVKAEIEAEGVKVIQWHRDEVEESVKGWVQTNGIRYPVVLSRTQNDSKGDVSQLANSKELAGCVGDANQFLALVTEKGVFKETSQSTL